MKVCCKISQQGLSMSMLLARSSLTPVLCGNLLYQVEYRLRLA